MSFLFQFEINSAEISLDHQVQVSSNKELHFGNTKYLKMCKILLTIHLQNLKQYEAACQKQTFMNTVLESKPSTQDGIAVNENWKITPKKINKVWS